jgi:hypothetical protein
VPTMIFVTIVVWLLFGCFGTLNWVLYITMMPMLCMFCERDHRLIQIDKIGGP